MALFGRIDLSCASSTEVIQVSGNSALDLILYGKIPNNPDCFAVSNSN